MPIAARTPGARVSQRGVVPHVTLNSTADFSRPLAALYHLALGYNIRGVKFLSWKEIPPWCGFVGATLDLISRPVCRVGPGSRAIRLQKFREPVAATDGLFTWTQKKQKNRVWWG